MRRQFPASPRRPTLSCQRLIVWSVLFVACSSRGDPSTRNDRAPSESPHAATYPTDDSIRRAHQDSLNRSPPGYIVDSTFPPDEAWRRFANGIGAPPAALANGATSRDALVQKWVDALESNDSVTVIRTAMNRPEFALLVYPASPSSRQPLYQPPAVLWSQLSSASLQGFRRSLVRLGGKPLGVLSYQCASAPVLQGKNRLWTDCRVHRIRASGDTITQRLFGAILERDGHFKFYSLANDM